MIITRSGKRSIDDLLSICLVSYATGDIHIKRVRHTNVPETIKGMSTEDTAINVGGVLDPYNRRFDPQQSIAFTEIASFYGVELPKGDLWDYFSDLTTKGVVEARKLHNMSLEQAEPIHRAVDTLLRVWDLILSEGDTETLLFIAIRCYLGQCDFKLDLVTLMGIQGIIAVAYPEQYVEADKQAGIYDNHTFS